MSNIIITPIALVEEFINDVYNANTKEKTAQVLDKFLHHHAIIHVNGLKVPREGLFTEFLVEKEREGSAKVTFANAVQGEFKAPVHHGAHILVTGLYFHSNFVKLMTITQPSAGVSYTVQLQGLVVDKDSHVNEEVHGTIIVVYVFDICDLTVLFNP